MMKPVKEIKKSSKPIDPRTFCTSFKEGNFRLCKSCSEYEGCKPYFKAGSGGSSAPPAHPSTHEDASR